MRSQWRNLLKQLKINTFGGQITPVRETELDAYEKKRGLKLPRSYRSYCTVFGAGEFGERYQIAVPGFKGTIEQYSLAHFDSEVQDGSEFDAYCKDPAQCKRGLFFGVDVVRTHYFFDPSEVTDDVRHEYAIYAMFVDYKVKRLADNFFELVTEYFLGPKHHLLIKGKASTLFMPVTV